MKEQSRLPPVTLDGSIRHAAERGDLGEREAAEEVQVH
jgi:hypothetical protein